MRLGWLAVVALICPVPCFAACGTDTVPAPAAAFGLTCETYSYNAATDGLGAIDTTDSQADGFKLYIHNNWPAAVANSYFSQGIALPSANLAIVSNRLVITPTADSGTPLFQNGLMTCVQNATTGYKGFVFTAPYYIDIGLTWTGSHTSQQSWPSFFTYPTEYLTIDGSGVDVLEIDNIEAPFGRNLHDTIVSGGVLTQNNSFNAAGGSSPYGVLNISPAVNGGTGIIQFYNNQIVEAGTLVNYFQNSPAIANGSTANVTPSNPNGTFYSGAVQHECGIIQGGLGQPATIDYLHIFQLPPTGGGRGLFRAINDNKPAPLAVMAGERRRGRVQ